MYTHLPLLLQTEGKDEEGIGARQVLGYVDLMPHLCSLLSFKMTSEYVVHSNYLLPACPDVGSLEKSPTIIVPRYEVAMC